MKNRRFKADYVVTLLDQKTQRRRDVVIPVEIDTSMSPDSYSFYIAALGALEQKARKGEIAVRVSCKGYS